MHTRIRLIPTPNSPGSPVCRHWRQSPQTSHTSDITGSSAIANGYVPYLVEGLSTESPTRGLIQLLCHMDYCKRQADSDDVSTKQQSNIEMLFIFMTNICLYIITIMTCVFSLEPGRPAKDGVARLKTVIRYFIFICVYYHPGKTNFTKEIQISIDNHNKVRWRKCSSVQ